MAFNDGGPLFPQVSIEMIGDNMAVQNFQGGATLWDFYAAMDLPVCQNGDWLGWFGGKAITDSFGRWPDCASSLDKLKWLAMVEAKIRALRADAMIAEREKRRAKA